MKIWLDDIRLPPPGWEWAKTSRAAIELLESVSMENISAISFDHDLGGDDTSRRVVLWMCERDSFPPTIHVHTANPVGREWLEGMINRYGPGVNRNPAQ